MNCPRTELFLGNHQEVLPFDEEWLRKLEAAGATAIPLVWAERTGDEVALAEAEEIDVALVDDDSIAAVHGEFMNDPEPTDVITFHHGEIVIGVETAQRQAETYDEPIERELLRYLVHGLLHLAGHEDAEDADRQRMEIAQEKIVGELWPELSRA